jgi:sulfate adenylyltransferase subunit 1
MLGIKHIVVCVNKMDLVNFSEDAFNAIKTKYQEFSSSLNIPDLHFIPISALKGDNVVDASKNMDWYKGKTLLQTLESVQIISDYNFEDARFPVQRVIRPQSAQYPDFRGFAGRVEGGVFRVGDAVTVLPSGLTTKITNIYNADVELKEAFSPMSVCITLENNIDISRGDMLVKSDNLPKVDQEIELMICWMNDKKMNPTGKYLLRHTTNEAKCVVKNVAYKMNINTLEKIVDNFDVEKNDIAKITLKSAKPLFFDAYKKNRGTGSVILVDEFSNETVGAGMIV